MQNSIRTEVFAEHERRKLAIASLKGADVTSSRRVRIREPPFLISTCIRYYSHPCDLTYSFTSIFPMRYAAISAMHVVVVVLYVENVYAMAVEGYKCMDVRKSVHMDTH
jgi:hypothetical protein